MLRSLVAAVLVLVLGVGVGLAAEFSAVITKIGDGKVTFNEMKGKEKGDEQTLPIAADAKILTAKFNKETKKVEAGDALKDGLKNEMFSKISEKGLRATIVTDADNKKVTEIRVFGGFGKKKQDK